MQDVSYNVYCITGKLQFQVSECACLKNSHLLVPILTVMRCKLFVNVALGVMFFVFSMCMCTNHLLCSILQVGASSDRVLEGC